MIILISKTVVLNHEKITAEKPGGYFFKQSG
ncbi:hypothetical protein ACWI_19940 [Acetobacterium wieringae]|uniref:Uncharacterized protein n=1 Tax=Acetobacterium wieringae TaxID=52694 RepID=A0A1F2PHK3_9FIRM|nr:hypothetical protein ACWI_19940 [Acetobacterium wieringae]